MLRIAIVTLVLAMLSAVQSFGQTDESNNDVTAAKLKFDQLLQQWVDVTAKLREKHQQSVAGGNGSIDEETKALQGQSEQLVDQIAAAGLDAYQADPQGYPVVNETLQAIARFFVTGDASGDGGDQYEKALPLVKALLKSGAGATSPELWLLGGVSAFSLNEYDLADEYFRAAKEAGVLGEQPPVRDRNDPRFRLWSLADSFVYGLAEYPHWWEEEQKLREAESLADDLPRVRMQTVHGDIVIELFENEAPQAVANFLTLAKQGFYDGVAFHRVIPGFMAQGGDSTRTESGGPGYSIPCECHNPDHRKHFRGSLSMAHAGRDTGGSQFFLTFIPIPREDPRIRLNGKHTVFGRVIEGMDAAAALKRRDPNAPNAPEPDKIIKAQVLRDRGHAYKFEKLPER